MERPEERERDGEQLVSGAVRAQTLINEVTALDGLWHPQNSYCKKFKAHWSQTIIISKIIMKKFEILWEWLKCDRDMKWINAVGEMVPIDLFDAGWS